MALFADTEMQKLFEELIERGQDVRRGCTLPFRWRSLRDPRRDTVWREPNRPLTTFLKTECRFLIVWDHYGSGYEARPSREVEELAAQRLVEAGVQRERILTVSFDPELEVSFRTVWPKIKKVVAEPRGIAPPEDSAILAEARRRDLRGRVPDDLDTALAHHPKELFEALVRLVRLRRSPDMYSKIGERVSLRALKGEQAIARVATAISTWFPPAS
ncbi:MAG TPA: hypothetical protein VF173_26690 [Thermoanaerobaculia bacterium]|nr:hypothetical protein [Thermoanaerobaculia bacterium]